MKDSDSGGDIQLWKGPVESLFHLYIYFKLGHIQLTEVECHLPPPKPNSD